MPAGQPAAVATSRARFGRRGMGIEYPSDARGMHDAVLTKTMHRAGLRGWQMQAASLGSVGLCVGLWIRAKTVDQDERGNAERRALFVGLWAPTFWQIGTSLERHD